MKDNRDKDNDKLNHLGYEKTPEDIELERANKEGRVFNPKFWRPLTDNEKVALFNFAFKVMLPFGIIAFIVTLFKAIMYYLKLSISAIITLTISSVCC